MKRRPSDDLTLHIVVLPAAMAAFAITAFSCAPAEQANAPPVVRDSAGVTIIESPMPPPGSGEADTWLIEAEPFVTIGDVEQEQYVLQFVHSVLRLDDGRILIIDEDRERRIRVFDGDGRYLESWGRAGGGPGEFGGSPRALHAYRGDSVAVIESGGSEIHIFDARGRFGRRFVPRYEFRPASDRRPSGGCCRIVDALPDGSFIAEGPLEMPVSGADPRRSVVRLFRISAEGALVSELGTFAADLRRDGSDVVGREWRMRIPFSGRFSAAVHGERIFVGNGVEHSLDELDRDGRRVRSLQIDRESASFDADAQRAYAAAYRAYLIEADGLILPSYDSILQAEFEHLPDRLPAYERIRVDPAGRTWLISSWVPFLLEGGYRALVLDRDGRPLGEVRFPAGTEIRGIGVDAVVGVTRTEDGAPLVVLHRIVRRARD